MRLARHLLFVAALTTAPAFAQVTVTDAWVRGTVAGQQASGAFMKLRATADTALVGASSPVARTIEIHEMKMEGGTMRMRAIDRLPIARGRTVDLSSAGHHLMIMGLGKPLEAGAKVPIALTFEDPNGKRTSVDVIATVRALGDTHHKH